MQTSGGKKKIRGASAKTRKTAGAVKAVKPSQAATPEPEIIAYKGFDKNFQCRDFQFEVGKTYEHDGEVKACASGFHACEHPMHVFQYYRAQNSRFARVTLGGKTDRHSEDTKIAAAKITIDAEISVSEMAVAAVKWVFARAKWKEGPVATGKNQGVTASGNSGAATASGYYGAATASGDSGAATASGDYGAATASGYYGAATASGNSGAATASGYSGAATASGYYGAATASGNSGAATASGYYGAATASGDSGKARGKDGCALFLCERDRNWKIVNVWGGIVGRDGIKPDTFYTLKNGKPVEV